MAKQTGGLPVYRPKAARRLIRFNLGKYLIRFGVIYTLYYLLLGCPSYGELKADSPQVCRRYYKLKEIAVTHVAPYVEQYASPYLQKGQPYYDQANVYYQKSQFAYDSYAVPVISRAGKEYASKVRPIVHRSSGVAQAQYERHLSPVVDRYYRLVYNRVNGLYRQYLGAHVDQVKIQYHRVAVPIISSAEALATRIANDVALPIYRQMLPAAEVGLNHSRVIYKRHVHPRLVKIINYLIKEFRTQVLPYVRIAWYTYVDPQLQRIKDRVFKFQASREIGKAQQVDFTAIAKSVSSSILGTSTLSSITTTFAGQSVVVGKATVAPATQKKIDSAVIETLLQNAMENIKKEGKNAGKALDEALDSMLPEIVRTEELLCADYLTQLEDMTLGEVDKVERRIQSLAASESNKGVDTEELAEILQPYLASAGKKIHARSTEIKAHTALILEKLMNRVNKRTYIVWDTVKDEVERQKKAPAAALGYELSYVSKADLKKLKDFDSRAETIEVALQKQVIKKVEPYYLDLKDLIKSTDIKVEALAGEAATKLKTLQSVGPRKITVNDDSDEFGHGYKPVAAILAARAIFERASTAIVGAPEPTPLVTSILSAASIGYKSAVTLVSDVVDNIDVEYLQSVAANANSVLGEQAKGAASAASSAAAVLQANLPMDSINSFVASQSLYAQSAASAVSSAVNDYIELDSLSSYAASVAAQASSQAAAAASMAGEYIDVSSINSFASSAASVASSQASRVASSAYGHVDSSSISSALSVAMSTVSAAVVQASSVAGKGASSASSYLDSVVDKNIDTASILSKASSAAAVYQSSVLSEASRASVAAESHASYLKTQARSQASLASAYIAQTVLDASSVSSAVSDAASAISSGASALRDSIDTSALSSSASSFASIASEQIMGSETPVLSKVAKAMGFSSQGSVESVRSKVISAASSKVSSIRHKVEL